SALFLSSAISFFSVCKLSFTPTNLVGCQSFGSQHTCLEQDHDFRGAEPRVDHFLYHQTLPFILRKIIHRQLLNVGPSTYGGFKSTPSAAIPKPGRHQSEKCAEA